MCVSLIVTVGTEVIHFGSVTIWAAAIPGSRTSADHRLGLRLGIGLGNRIGYRDRNRGGLRLRRWIRIALNDHNMTHKCEK
jgi:hypothetical protein